MAKKRKKRKPVVVICSCGLNVLLKSGEEKKVCKCKRVVTRKHEKSKNYFARRCPVTRCVGVSIGSINICKGCENKHKEGCGRTKDAERIELHLKFVVL